MGALQGQNLGALNNIFGTQAGLLGSGLSGIQNMAAQYGIMGQNAANNAFQGGSPWGSALGGLGQAANSLWGPGGAWASSRAASTPFQSAYNAPGTPGGMGPQP